MTGAPGRKGKTMTSTSFTERGAPPLMVDARAKSPVSDAHMGKNLWILQSVIEHLCAFSGGPACLRLGFSGARPPGLGAPPARSGPLAWCGSWGPGLLSRLRPAPAGFGPGGPRRLRPRPSASLRGPFLRPAVRGGAVVWRCVPCAGGFCGSRRGSRAPGGGSCRRAQLYQRKSSGGFRGQE